MSDTAAVTLKVGSLASIALGPILSQRVTMAPDLRPWAMWLSVVIAAAAWVVLTVALRGTKAGRGAWWALWTSTIVFVLAAFGHVAINLWWTAESGTDVDFYWQMGIVGTFAVAAGGITGALRAVQELVKKDDAKSAGPTRDSKTS